MAEDLPDQAADAVALHGRGEHTRGDGKSQARESQRVGTGSGLKKCLGIAPPALIDMIELRLVTEPLAGSESERPDGISAAAAYRPLLSGGGGYKALTALGAAPGQNQAAALGGHAGPEAMGAHTADLAWLVGAFHCLGFGGEKGAKGTQRPGESQLKVEAGRHATGDIDSPAFSPA